MSTRGACQQHNKYGFSSYSGPLLKGQRYELSIHDNGYPQALRTIAKPAKKLFCIGNPAAMQEGLAIVGARKATPYGRECALRFGSIAARRGIVIISGGARGCDCAGHTAALQAGTPTVVFLGGGCDQLYPAENYQLFQQIVDAGGAIVSEQEWNFPPMPYAFRSRNRLIAGLAKATLIVEAGLPSGTFSTADEALSASKEVLVVPGAITSQASSGANLLIYQGATPIISNQVFEDVLFGIFGCLAQEEDKKEEGGFPCKEKNLGAEILGRSKRSSDAKNDAHKVASHRNNVVDGGLKQPVDGLLLDGDVLFSEKKKSSAQEMLRAALASRPSSLEELCEHIQDPPSGYSSVFSWCAEQLEELERKRLIVRLPDGRYIEKVYREEGSD